MTTARDELPEANQMAPAVGIRLDRTVRRLLGTAPTQAEIDRLMKRCQVGVGGRHALDNAHDIMAECYGTLGRQQIEIDRLRWALTDVLKVATSWSLFNTTTIDRQPSPTALRLKAAEAVLRQE